MKVVAKYIRGWRDHTSRMVTGRSLRAGAKQVNAFTAGIRRMKKARGAAHVLCVLLAMASLAAPCGAFSQLEAAEETFRDCDVCPRMVVVPAGRFMMGSSDEEQGRWPDEGPRREVHVSASFALGKFEVTREEFAAFARATGHEPDAGCVYWDAERMQEWYSWSDPGFAQTGRHPVTCVNWQDATAYASWLSVRTGQTYRLPSEAEWEYAVRAGTLESRYWGPRSDQACNHANVFDATSKNQNAFRWDAHECDDGFAFTSPAGRFRPNAYGLHDMLGNVFEWVEDCWNDSYRDAPLNGIVWLEGDCTRRILRGGSWINHQWQVRSASRIAYRITERSPNLGFRIAKTLENSGLAP